MHPKSYSPESSTKQSLPCSKYPRLVDSPRTCGLIASIILAILTFFFLLRISHPFILMFPNVLSKVQTPARFQQPLLYPSSLASIFSGDFYATSSSFTRHYFKATSTSFFQLYIVNFASLGKQTCTKKRKTVQKLSKFPLL